MKTFNFLSRFVTLSFVLRTMLIIALYVFSVTLSQAQNSISSSAIEQSKSNTVQQPQQSVINKNQNPEAKNFNVASSPVKVAEHAPDPNDADYEIKKEARIKNYPNEYKYSITRQNTKTVETQKKSGEHAPDYNDPDYAAKKAEWIRNYPEEYKQWMEQKLEKKESK